MSQLIEHLSFEMTIPMLIFSLEPFYPTSHSLQQWHSRDQTEDNLSTDSSISHHQRSTRQTPHGITSASPIRQQQKLAPRHWHNSRIIIAFGHASCNSTASLPSRIAPPPITSGARDKLPRHHLGQPNSTRPCQRIARSNIGTTSQSSLPAMWWQSDVDCATGFVMPIRSYGLLQWLWCLKMPIF